MWLFWSSQLPKRTTPTKVLKTSVSALGYDHVLKAIKSHKSWLESDPPGCVYFFSGGPHHNKIIPFTAATAEIKCWPVKAYSVICIVLYVYLYSECDLTFPKPPGEVPASAT